MVSPCECNELHILSPLILSTVVHVYSLTFVSRLRIHTFESITMSPSCFRMDGHVHWWCRALILFALSDVLVPLCNQFLKVVLGLLIFFFFHIWALWLRCNGSRVLRGQLEGDGCGGQGFPLRCVRWVSRCASFDWWVGEGGESVKHGWCSGAIEVLLDREGYLRHYIVCGWTRFLSYMFQGFSLVILLDQLWCMYLIHWFPSVVPFWVPFPFEEVLECLLSSIVLMVYYLLLDL